MKDFDRQTRAHLMELFEQHGFHPRKDLGQNFLIDINLVEFVVESARIEKSDVVLEIGSGTGGMTTFMCWQAGHVVSVEIDSNVHALAAEAVAKFDNVTLLHTDALKNKNHFNPDVLAVVEEQLAVDPERRLKLVANLPYNVATPIVSNLVASELPWSRMVVTIQKELAERMVARAGGGKYGSLAVWLQSQCRVRILKKLNNQVFWPRPKVDSAIIQIDPDERGRERIADRPFFLDYVRRLFHQRRKLMRSVLVGMYKKQVGKETVDAILADLELGPNTRAEAIPVKTHVELANRLHAAIGGQESRVESQEPEQASGDRL